MSVFSAIKQGNDPQTGNEVLPGFCAYQVDVIPSENSFSRRTWQARPSTQNNFFSAASAAAAGGAALATSRTGNSVQVLSLSGERAQLETYEGVPAADPQFGSDEPDSVSVAVPEGTASTRRNQQPRVPPRFPTPPMNHHSSGSSASFTVTVELSISASAFDGSAAPAAASSDPGPAAESEPVVFDKKKTPPLVTTSVNGRAHSQWFHDVSGALVDPALAGSATNLAPPVGEMPRPASRMQSRRQPEVAASVPHDEVERPVRSLGALPAEGNEALPKERLAADSFPIVPVGSESAASPLPALSQSSSAFTPPITPPLDTRALHGDDLADIAVRWGSSGDGLGRINPHKATPRCIAGPSPSSPAALRGLNNNGHSSAAVAMPPPAPGAASGNGMVASARKCDKCLRCCAAFTSCLSYVFCLKWARC